MKRQRLPNEQSKMDNPDKLATQGTQYEALETTAWESKMDNPDKLATQGTQYEALETTEWAIKNGQSR